MIARDNEATIRRCLESIRPWVDEMIVVDTGSSDTTPKIAEECGASVSFFPWCDDFSAARNVSFEKASGEWLFWMDTDDYIPPHCGRLLRDIAEGPHAPDILGYGVQVHCPGDVEGDLTIVDHVKLVRNHPAIRFEFRIHEQLLPSIRRLGGDVARSNVYVVHEGSRPTPEMRAHKRERDLRILAKEVEDRPNHPFALFNLGMTHSDLGNHELACQFLERCLAVSDINESQVPKAIALLVGSLAALGRFDQAARACEQGIDTFNDDIELWFRYAIVLNDLDRVDEAISAYQRVISIPNQQRFRSVDPGVGTYKAMFNLSMLLRHHGRASHAESLLREAIRCNPLWAPAHQKLVEVLLEGRKFNAAEIALEAFQKTLPNEELLTYVEGRRLEAQGDIEAARDKFSTLLQSNALDSESLESLGRFFFEHGPDDQAVIVLSRLAESRPSDGAPWHNLGAVQIRLGMLDAARDSLERSLALRPDAHHTRTLIEQLVVSAESV